MDLANCVNRLVLGSKEIMSQKRTKSNEVADDKSNGDNP